jgi:hypothetical protein
VWYFWVMLSSFVVMINVVAIRNCSWIKNELHCHHINRAAVKYLFIRSSTNYVQCNACLLGLSVCHFVMHALSQGTLRIFGGMSRETLRSFCTGSPKMRSVPRESHAMMWRMKVATCTLQWRFLGTLYFRLPDPLCVVKRPIMYELYILASRPAHTVMIL